MIRYVIIAVCALLVAAGNATAFQLPASVLKFSGETEVQYADKLTDGNGVAEVLDNLLSVLREEDLPVDELASVWTLILELYDAAPAQVISADGFLSVRALATERLTLNVKRLNIDKSMTMYKHLQKNGHYPDEYLGKVYADWFLKQSNLKLSRYADPPSKSIDEINIKNPTHYKAMSTWMASMATAMANGVRPDEAEIWTTEHRHEWEEGEPVTTATPAIIATTTPATVFNPTAPAVEKPTAANDEPAQSQPEASGEATTSNQSGGLPWWLWVIGGGAIVLLLGIFAFWKRKKD